MAEDKSSEEISPVLVPYLKTIKIGELIERSSGQRLSGLKAFNDKNPGESLREVYTSNRESFDSLLGKENSSFEFWWSPVDDDLDDRTPYRVNVPVPLAYFGMRIEDWKMVKLPTSEFISGAPEIDSQIYQLSFSTNKSPMAIVDRISEGGPLNYDGDKTYDEITLEYSANDSRYDSHRRYTIGLNGIKKKILMRTNEMERLAISIADGLKPEVTVPSSNLGEGFIEVEAPLRAEDTELLNALLDRFYSEVNKRLQETH